MVFDMYAEKVAATTATVSVYKPIQTQFTAESHKKRTYSPENTRKQSEDTTIQLHWRYPTNDTDT